MPTFAPARILRDRFATTNEPESAIRHRLERFLGQLRQKAAPLPDPDGTPEAEEFELSDPGLSATDRAHIRARARRFVQRRNALPKPPSRMERGEETALKALASGGRVTTITQPEAYEIAARLHARAPWMANASTAVMRDMVLRSAHEPGVAGCGPLILDGPPGIGKSAWARHLGELLSVPVVALDIGAAQGGTFALTGAERGWGSAHAGRLVTEFLRSGIANPIVIIDEIGRAPENVPSSRGGTLPGILGALMSMIEPTTARDWACPYYQLRFDLSRITWIMTSNEVRHLPQPFLDRCRVVTCEGPGPQHLRPVLERIGSGRLWDPADERPDDSAHFRAVEDMMLRVFRNRPYPSLRQIERLVQRAETLRNRPRWV